MGVSNTNAIAGVVNSATAVQEGQHAASFHVSCHQGVDNQHRHVSSLFAQQVLGLGDGSSSQIVAVISSDTSTSSLVQTVTCKGNTKQTSQLADDLGRDVLVDLAGQLRSNVLQGLLTGFVLVKHVRSKRSTTGHDRTVLS